MIANTLRESEGGPVGDPSLAEIQQIVQRRTNLDIGLTDPVWLSRFRIAHRKVPKFRIGRIFLAGDSAHVHSPAGGQGMNTGIQDAFNLAWKLGLVCHGKCSDSLLDSYNEEREPVAKMVLTLTDGLTRIIASPKPLERQLLSGLLPMLTGIHSVERLGEVREWLKYDIPRDLIGQAWSGKYRGQTQKWFAVRFTGDDSEINVSSPGGGAHDPEFIAWKWEPIANLPDLVVPFKRPVYERVVKEFAKFAGG